MRKKPPGTKSSNAPKKRPKYRDYLGRLDIGSPHVPELELDPAKALAIVTEHKAWAASLFTQQRIEELAADFNITEELGIAALTEFLRESARFYRDHKNYLNEAPTIIEYQQRFQKVKVAAKELTTALKALTDEERAFLWHPLQDWKLQYFNEQTGEAASVPNCINAFDNDGTPVISGGKKEG